MICGWTPAPDPGTISLLSRSLYAARQEVGNLKTIEVRLRERLETVTEALDRRMDVAVEAEVESRRAMLAVIKRYIAAHDQQNYNEPCQCLICIDARTIS